MKRLGFTLIEILVVVGIIALIAAILFPVFSSARGKSRQAACISNLHQIGMAISLYAQDNDQLFPEGVDPVDKYSNLWQGYEGNQFTAIIPKLSLLSQLLDPYIKSAKVWECPSDTGFDQLYAGTGPFDFSAHPSSYQQYGMSYYYRTEIGLRHETLAGLVAYDDFPPYAEHGPAEINVLMDGVGTWHGGSGEGGRFDVLMGDCHVQNMTFDALASAWELSLVRPTPPTPPSN